MCGIAGVVDLTGNRPVPEGIARRMADALIHRGPDDDGMIELPGVTLASRRLNIVGIENGRQPFANEAGNAHVVFNGELFDHDAERKALQSRGHTIRTKCDTEIIPHLWEERGDAVFEYLRGQFAVAIWDSRGKRLLLGRDRFGISPLYWTRQGDWLLFASEIKALLASGMVEARADARGIDHMFSFSALPGPITCFEGVQMLRPGHFLTVEPAQGSREPFIGERAYWQMDFPDEGDEDPGTDTKQLVDQFEEIMLRAVERRLRADVPVGTYLSGGLDSSLIVAMAKRLRGDSLNVYTIRVHSPELDELSAAEEVCAYLGLKPPIVEDFHRENTAALYPDLIRAAESPVIDTSCAALMSLARRVSANGQKVVLTGEGADEWLVGYPWYKVARIFGALDKIPGLPLSNHLRRLVLRLKKMPTFPRDRRMASEAAVGGPNAWIDACGVLGLNKLIFYGEGLREKLGETNPWADLGMDLDRAARWHPLNRGIWVAARMTLAGHLLMAKGDRVSMAASVEARYPFLDEEVFDFTARLHPRWKLRGFRDKVILRELAARWLPPAVAKRRKAVFRAPLDGFQLESKYIDQLLSDESLQRTGYFDAKQVHHWRRAIKQDRLNSMQRLSVEMGLAGVIATQLWHHIFIGDSLAELP